MEVLILNCWIRGSNVGSVFMVEVSRTDTLTDLKKAIKKKMPVTFRNVDGIFPHLYKPHRPVPSPFEKNLGEFVLSEDGELLVATGEELSELFPELPPRRHIHIIVDAPVLMIACWLRGSTLDDRFQILIRADATISELRDHIRKAEWKPRNVGAHIRLYRISGGEDEVQECLDRMGDGQPLQGNTLLPNFLDVPVLNPFYVVAEDASSANDCTTPSQVEEQSDILTALTESFKRTITITSKSLTPSQAAKSSEYAKIQHSEQRLLDCRCAASNPVNTVAPPIQLFHPAFAYFSSNAFDPSYDVPDDFVLNIRDLMAQFTLIHPSEDVRRLRLRSFLQKAIHQPLTFIRSSVTTPVIAAQSSCREFLVYLVVSEEQNELGDRGPDPSVQAAFTFLRLLSQPENSELYLRCCCPTFIIAHAGPWLTIMGGIITADCIVQRLTDFLWIPIHSAHDDDDYVRIARVFYALRKSLERLDSWYKTIVAVTPFNPLVPTTEPHPRFFPSPNTYWYNNAAVEFIYQEPLENNISCVTYRAKTTGGSPKDIIVKFVTSYNVDVHRKMASAGFAPELLYHGPIFGGPDMPSYGKLRMVVMEHAEGLMFEAASKQRELRPRFEADLRRAFEYLHDAGYVFGDLRKPNIIVTPKRTSTVQLIDFGWAGREGYVKYPVSISGSTKWAAGIRGLAIIEKAHDLAMLDLLMSSWPQ